MPFVSRRFQRRSATRIEARSTGADVRVAIEKGEEILGLPLGAAADHQRQAEIAVLDERFEHRAVGGDDVDVAVLLPEREGLTLGDR